MFAYVYVPQDLLDPEMVKAADAKGRWEWRVFMGKP